MELVGNYNKCNIYLNKILKDGLELSYISGFWENLSDCYFVVFDGVNYSSVTIKDLIASHKVSRIEGVNCDEGGNYFMLSSWSLSAIVLHENSKYVGMDDITGNRFKVMSPILVFGQDERYYFNLPNYGAVYEGKYGIIKKNIFDLFLNAFRNSYLYVDNYFDMIFIKVLYGDRSKILIFNVDPSILSMCLYIKGD